MRALKDGERRCVNSAIAEALSKCGIQVTPEEMSAWYTRVDTLVATTEPKALRAAACAAAAAPDPYAAALAARAAAESPTQPPTFAATYATQRREAFETEYQRQRKDSR